MENLRPPSELKLSGNVDDNWKRFKQRFELYLLAIGADEKGDARKVGIFLTVAGTEALDVYNTLEFTTAEKNDNGSVKYSAVIKKFDAYCMPKKNETFERYVFRCRMQKEGETLEQYLTDLRIKSQSCNFGTLTQSLIRDQLVVGITDRKVKERLLREPDLALDKAVQICQAAETATLHMQALTVGATASDVPETTVNAVKQKKPSSAAQRVDHPRNQRNKSAKSKCSSCGYEHAVEGRCPATGQTCYRCKAMNHFASVCRNTAKVHDVENATALPEPRSTASDDQFFIGAIENDKSPDEEEWISPLVVNGSIIPFKLDTGAQVNVLPMKDYKELQNKPRLMSKTVRLRAYNGEPIPTAGVCRAKVVCKGQDYNVLFVIAKVDSQPILGLQTCEKLGLVKRVHVINTEAVKVQPSHAASTSGSSSDTSPKKGLAEDSPVKGLVGQYADVFEGIGCLPMIYKIQLRDDAEPVIHAMRTVPESMKPRLAEELKELEQKGIVSRIKEPTDWVSSLVIIEKSNGKLRLCLDPTDLNRYIKREHYHIPTRAEATSNMAGAQWFSKLDATSGFWHITLDQESAKLTTFNTPFGRYHFNRLPFGISSAPEVFHRTVAQLFEGIEGMRTIHDDVVSHQLLETCAAATLLRVYELPCQAGPQTAAAH